MSGDFMRESLSTRLVRKVKSSFQWNNYSINIYNGIAISIASNLVNPYYAKFIERLGANDYHMAYLNSLPAFISLFALIPGAILIDSSSNKLKTTTWIMFMHKIFFLLIAAVPLVSGVSKPWLFVILIALMNLPGSVYSMGYQSSIGDIFTPRERGMAMGQRNKYSDIFRLGITLLSGVLLSMPKSDSEVILLYQVFFILSFFLGLFEVYTFSKFTVANETVHTPSKQRFSKIVNAFKDSFRFTFKDKAFKKFLIASLLFYFGWQLGWPLFNIYTINKLGANEAWLSAISIANGIASILTVSYWAKFADKKGNGIAIFVATFGMSVTPFLYVLSQSLWSLLFFNIFIGISIIGTTLVLFNLLLEATPRENRTTIISIYNTFIAVSATFAPVLAVWIMEQTSLDISLMVTGFFRFVGCFAFFIISRKKFNS